MATTPVCVIDQNGISVPAYTDVLTYLKSAYQGIYGSDVYLEPDSLDGQFVALLALAITDANNMAASVYNAFSPSTAQGVGLSSVVKINGIARNIASNSTVDVALIGVAGTTVTNGIVSDDAGNNWSLPASVVIPPSGTITVTAVCQTIGAVTAAIGAVSTIATPTRGWQSVSNAAIANPGNPVETDANLRNRQATSTALPSLTILEGIVGALAAITGVTRYRAYENDTDVTDSNGIPSHSIAIIIEGGDAQAIGQTIADRKTPGSGTFGTTTVTVVDAIGVSHAVKFSRPVSVGLKAGITVKAFAGYTVAIENALKQAVADYINALPIGQSVYFTRLYVPANLGNSISGSTYEVTNLQIAKLADPLAAADVTIAFNEAAACSASNITVTVT
ncbi:hypothetical protein N5C81_14955 [Rhizobium pusense]|uniref:baseplate J/gp47 family protein n=1 Tax=Agrobacterium pusense TaxID=648995 RepID=UPI00244B0ADF|nr:hypothetical protein [Agrobacterium pusense]MDH1268922.1 hypothetical protein [Agrobacterium pusense]